MNTTDNIDLVRRFFERWAVSFDEACASFEDTLSNDCVWDQKPMTVTIGPSEAVRFMRRTRSIMGLDRIEVELISIVGSGSIVHTQRIDRLYRSSGALLAEAPVAGVMHLRDGKITQWKEYFDSPSFVANTLLQMLRRLTGRN